MKTNQIIIGRTSQSYLAKSAFYSTLFAIFFLPISKACVEIGSLTAIVSWLLNRYVQKNQAHKFPLIIIAPYGIFLSHAALSIVTLDPSLYQVGVRGWLKWAQFMGFFLVCLDLFQSKEKRELALRVFIASMILVAVNGFYQLATGTGFLRHKTLDPGRITRMKSSLGAANLLATLLYVALAVVWGKMLGIAKWTRSKMGYALIFVMFASCWVLTFSRSAFIALAVSTLAYLILKNKWRVFVFTFLAITVPLILFAPVRKQVVPTFDPLDHTVHERVQFWQTAWHLIEEKPWLGHGVNTYLRVVEPTETEQGTYRAYPHNSYLQLWAELGLSGVIVLILPPVLFAVSRLRKNAVPSSDATMASMLGIVLFAFHIQAIFDNHFFSFEAGFLYWGFWGMLLALHPSDSKVRS